MASIGLVKTALQDLAQSTTAANENRPTQPPSSLLMLPTELLWAIASFLPEYRRGQKQLLALRLVCRRFENGLEAVIWRRITVPLMRIRELAFPLGTAFPSATFPRHTSMERIERFSRLFDRVGHNCRRLRLDFRSAWHHDEISDLRAFVRYRQASTLNSFTSPCRPPRFEKTGVLSKGYRARTAEATMWPKEIIDAISSLLERLPIVRALEIMLPTNCHDNDGYTQERIIELAMLVSSGIYSGPLKNVILRNAKGCGSPALGPLRFSFDLANVKNLIINTAESDLCGCFLEMVYMLKGLESFIFKRPTGSSYSPRNRPCCDITTNETLPLSRLRYLELENVALTHRHLTHVLGWSRKTLQELRLRRVDLYFFPVGYVDGKLITSGLWIGPPRQTTDPVRPTVTPAPPMPDESEQRWIAPFIRETNKALRALSVSDLGYCLSGRRISPGSPDASGLYQLDDPDPCEPNRKDLDRRFAKVAMGVEPDTTIVDGKFLPLSGGGGGRLMLAAG